MGKNQQEINKVVEVLIIVKIMIIKQIFGMLDQQNNILMNFLGFQKIKLFGVQII